MPEGDGIARGTMVMDVQGGTPTGSITTEGGAVHPFSGWMEAMLRRALACAAAAAALVFPTGAVASSSQPSRARSLQVDQVVWISTDALGAGGRRLTVGIAHSGVGAAAVLKNPEIRPNFPNLRRAQQWLVLRNLAADSRASISFRNRYSGRCLTAARPHGSPVYLGVCNNGLGQAWAYNSNRMLWSLNYNQTFPAGCSCTTLDIPNFRNVVDTPLVVARHTGTWNQLWRITIVPQELR